MTNEQIIDRIRKCLALTESPYPGEAANAAAMVQKLLFQHKLTMEDLDIEEKGPIGEQTMDLNPRRHEGHWRVKLVYAISKYNFCSMIQSWDSKKAFIIGTKNDIEIVQEIYHYAAEQLSREERLANTRRNKTFRRSFFTAAVNTIRGRLYEQWDNLEKESEASTALVVNNEEALKGYVEEHFGELRKGRHSGSYGSASGHAAGREAGSRVNIGRRSKQLAGGGLLGS